MIERAMRDEVASEMGRRCASDRFVPLVMMYEFEAGVENDLVRIRNELESPEKINDSPQTAPSKRILSLVPRYRKVLDGTIAAKQMGLRGCETNAPT